MCLLLLNEALLHALSKSKNRHIKLFLPFLVIYSRCTCTSIYSFGSQHYIHLQSFCPQSYIIFNHTATVHENQMLGKVRRGREIQTQFCQWPYNSRRVCCLRGAIEMTGDYTYTVCQKSRIQHGVPHTILIKFRMILPFLTHRSFINTQYWE